MKVRVGFGVKLTVLVLGPMLALALVFALVVRRATGEFVHRQMSERGMTMVTNLSRAVAYPMYVGLGEQLTEAARGLTARVGAQRLNPDLGFVLVLDNQGRPLASEGGGLTPGRLKQVSAQAMKITAPTARPGKDYFVFYAPVRYRETVVAMAGLGELEEETKTTVHELGAVALGLSLSGVQQRQQELVTTILQAVGLAALAALGLSWVLTRSVIRPIGQLKLGVQALARGDLGARVAVPEGDEIGEAAAQFNKMAQAIEQQTEDLKQKNAQLAVTQDELKRRMKDLSFLYDLELESATVTSLGELSVLLVRQVQRQFAPAGGFLAEEGCTPLGMEGEAAFALPPAITFDALDHLLGGLGPRLLRPEADAAVISRLAAALGWGDLPQRHALALPVVVHKKNHGLLLLVAPAWVRWGLEDLRMAEMTAAAYANHVERVGLIEREMEVVKLMAEREAGRRYTAELEEKNRALGELNRNLQDAYENLQRTQQQLVQSEKLATVGTLAGGIAHEINNPLGAILANTQMLQRKVQDETVQKGLGIIEKGAIRCKNIVEKVLRFARQRERVHTQVNLQTVVEDSLTLLTHQMKQLQVQKEIQPTPPVWGDASELEQVLTNLLLNAWHAVTAMHEQDGRKPEIVLSLYPENGHVVLRVRDNGVGMNRHVQQKAFDPFFTTKEVGQGTGLGLSVSYAILQAHRAEVSVESAERVGTTFTLRFPTTPPPEGLGHLNAGESP